LNPTPNLKLLITIYANAPTILLYRWTSMHPVMKHRSRSLFIELFSKTIIFLSESSLLFYKTCFSHRHLSCLPILCPLIVSCAFVIFIKGFTYLRQGCRMQKKSCRYRLMTFPIYLAFFSDANDPFFSRILTIGPITRVIKPLLPTHALYIPII